MTPLLLALNLLCGADATTTQVALRHGAREITLPTQNPWAATALLASESAGMSYGLLSLNRQHPRLARVIGWTAVGIRAAVVAHNVRELRK